MGTILVIDDEEGVRSTLQAMLEAAYHTVLLAESGSEGIAKLEEHIDELDAVIVDVIMPDISGLKVMGRARELKERLPVIVISGENEDRIEGVSPLVAASEDASAVLKKPFSSEDINNIISQFLN